MIIAVFKSIIYMFIFYFFIRIINYIFNFFYKIFNKKKKTLKSEKKDDDLEMVKCEKCGLYILKNEAELKDGKFKCKKK